MSETCHRFLICTVGGSAEPIAAAIQHWAPRRVLFLPSSDTRGWIEEKIIPLLANEGIPLDPGRFDVVELPDAQDFGACVQALRALSPRVEEWISRGEDFEVVLDFTGGTKCMSAALALQGHRWRCLFSYVGGTQRTKENVGVVISGKEQILHSQNPWDSLGYQAAEDAAMLFDRGSFDGASTLLRSALRSVGHPARKRELNALLALTEAYDFWDRFEHGHASSKLRDVAKNENDLISLLGTQAAKSLLTAIMAHRRVLDALVAEKGPTQSRIADLLANALRCAERGRYDDAVARLYRGIEAIAQCRLAVRYNVTDTSHIRAEAVPDALRSEWETRFKDGVVQLGLQDDYALLAAWNDSLSGRFHSLRLNDPKKSPLTARNQSILAHGFEPVSEKVFQHLRDSALELWSALTAVQPQSSPIELVQFPKLDHGAS